MLPEYVRMRNNRKSVDHTHKGGAKFIPVLHHGVSSSVYWASQWKNEGLKSHFFGLAYSLTIQLKCKNVAGLVLIACLVPEVASCLEMWNTTLKKWDFAHVLYTVLNLKKMEKFFHITWTFLGGPLLVNNGTSEANIWSENFYERAVKVTWSTVARLFLCILCCI